MQLQGIIFDMDGTLCKTLPKTPPNSYPTQTTQT